MKPGPLNLPTIWRGCDWGPVTLKWKDQNGDPINLAGWKPKAESLNIDLNPVITDAALGITTLSLNRVQTANLRLGVEGWDWIWERINDEYRFPPFLSGKVPIKQPQTSTNGVLPIGPPPPNDNFLDAIILEGDTGTIDGTNVNATREAGEPAGENSVWYEWTTSKSWTAFAGFGVNLLHIGVYTGEAPNALTLVTQSGNVSQVSWPAVAGQTYKIRIFKKVTVTPFTLHWLLQLPELGA